MRTRSLSAIWAVVPAAALDAGDTNAALNMLQSFINKVEAQAGKKISKDAAAELIEAVEEIISDNII